MFCFYARPFLFHPGPVDRRLAFEFESPVPWDVCRGLRVRFDSFLF